MISLTRSLFLAVFIVLTAAAPAQVRITEVNLQAQRVELTNFGATTVNLATWQWCRRRSYVAVGGTIAAGETRQYSLSMNTTSSDLGLYKSSIFGSASDMEDFIQWGGSFVSNGREGVAVSKGIWTSGTFFPVPASGLSFHARGQPSATGLRTGNWFTGRPHDGFPVPAPQFESFTVTGGEWRLIVNSFHLAPALKTEANAELGGTWQLQTPAVVDLTGGRFDIRFSAAGPRQFVRVRAQP